MMCCKTSSNQWKRNPTKTKNEKCVYLAQLSSRNSMCAFVRVRKWCIQTLAFFCCFHFASTNAGWMIHNPFDSVDFPFISLSLLFKRISYSFFFLSFPTMFPLFPSLHFLHTHPPSGALSSSSHFRYFGSTKVEQSEAIKAPLQVCLGGGARIAGRKCMKIHKHLN